VDSRQPLPNEIPEVREHIFERFENRQISRFEYRNQWDNPYGGTMFGFQCTDATRIVIMACPNFTEGARAPFILRPVLFEDPNFIWSPSVVRHVTRDRRQAGEPEADELQRYLEGSVIRRLQLLPEITEWGGEQLAFEFSDDSRLLVRAIPPKAGRRWPGGTHLTADYTLFFFKSPLARATIVTPS
jgi:hypothetical protein